AYTDTHDATTSAIGSEPSTGRSWTAHRFHIVLPKTTICVTICGPMPQGRSVEVPMLSTTSRTGVVPVSWVMIPDHAVVTENTITAVIAAATLARHVLGRRRTRKTAIVTPIWNALMAYSGASTDGLTKGSTSANSVIEVRLSQSPTRARCASRA